MALLAMVAGCGTPCDTEMRVKHGSLRASPAAAASEQGLHPVTEFAGPFLKFDFPAMRIGVAEYQEGPTGTTVFWFPKGVRAVVDVRGGAPGTIDTEGLRLGYESHFVDAICFAGGGSYGHAAATGVSAALLATGATSTRWDENLATVPGAIVFDFGGRFTNVYPDAALGAAALRAAVPNRFLNGAHGAGRFVIQGKYFEEYEWAGQGGAFRQVGPVKIAVFTVVNAMGAIVDREGLVVRCNHPAEDGFGHSIASHFARATERNSAKPASTTTEGPSKNTTVTLVVTNAKLRHSQLQRLAVQVHTSMGRAIQPFHTQDDGDTLFAVTTDEVESSTLDFADLAVHASEAAWDAVLASIPPPTIRPLRTAIRLQAAQLDAVTGSYEFRPGAIVTFTREGERLFGESTDKELVTGFAKGAKEELFAESPTRFFLPGRWDDWYEFVAGPDGKITGLIFHPGHWPVPAQRLPHSHR